MNLKKLSFAILGLTSLFLLSTSFCLAQETKGVGIQGAAEEAGVEISCPVGVPNCDSFQSGLEVPAQIAEETQKYSVAGTQIFVLKVIGGLLTFAAIAAVVMLTAGGFRLASAGGSQEKIQAAHKHLLWTLLGLGAIMIALIIVRNVTEIVYQNIESPAAPPAVVTEAPADDPETPAAPTATTCDPLLVEDGLHGPLTEAARIAMPNLAWKWGLDASSHRTYQNAARAPAPAPAAVTPAPAAVTPTPAPATPAPAPEPTPAPAPDANETAIRANNVGVLGVIRNTVNTIDTVGIAGRQESDRQQMYERIVNRAIGSMSPGIPLTVQRMYLLEVNRQVNESARREEDDNWFFGLSMSEQQVVINDVPLFDAWLATQNSQIQTAVAVGIEEAETQAQAPAPTPDPAPGPTPTPTPAGTDGGQNIVQSSSGSSGYRVCVEEFQKAYNELTNCQDVDAIALSFGYGCTAFLRENCLEDDGSSYIEVAFMQTGAPIKLHKERNSANNVYIDSSTSGGVTTTYTYAGGIRECRQNGQGTLTKTITRQSSYTAASLIARLLAAIRNFTFEETYTGTFSWDVSKRQWVGEGTLVSTQTASPTCTAGETGCLLSPPASFIAEKKGLWTSNRLAYGMSKYASGRVDCHDALSGSNWEGIQDTRGVKGTIQDCGNPAASAAAQSKFEEINGYFEEAGLGTTPSGTATVTAADTAEGTAGAEGSATVTTTSTSTSTTTTSTSTSLSPPASNQGGGGAQQLEPASPQPAGGSGGAIEPEAEPEVELEPEPEPEGPCSIATANLTAAHKSEAQVGADEINIFGQKVLVTQVSTMSGAACFARCKLTHDGITQEWTGDSSADGFQQAGRNCAQMMRVSVVAYEANKPCPADTFGANCTPCGCGEHGTCTSPGRSGTGGCTCEEGWTGATCAEQSCSPTVLTDYSGAEYHLKDDCETYETGPITDSPDLDSRSNTTLRRVGAVWIPEQVGDSGLNGVGVLISNLIEHPNVGLEREIQERYEGNFQNGCMIEGKMYEPSSGTNEVRAEGSWRTVGENCVEHSTYRNEYSGSALTFTTYRQNGPIIGKVQYVGGKPVYYKWDGSAPLSQTLNGRYADCPYSAGTSFCCFECDMCPAGCSQSAGE